MLKKLFFFKNSNFFLKKRRALELVYNIDGFESVYKYGLILDHAQLIS